MSDKQSGNFKPRLGEALEARTKLTAKAYSYAPTDTMEQSETIRQALTQKAVGTDTVEDALREAREALRAVKRADADRRWIGRIANPALTRINEVLGDV